MISIIILGSGVGSRFGATIPKQFITIDGKKIINFSVEKFLSLKDKYKLEIIVVSHPDRNDTYPAGVKFVEGGSTRFTSFLKGYHAISPNTTKVLVHDAVRPLISRDIIIRLINELDTHDAAIPIIKPYSSTIIEMDGNIKNINRDIISMTQTPEAFRRNIFDRLYDVEASNSDERTSIFSLFVDNQDKCSIKLIEGSQDNIKITTRSDLDLAIHLLEKKELPITNLKTLQGKTALILGGTGDIGFSITQSLTDCGASVVVTDSALQIENDDSLKQFEANSYDIIVHSIGILAYKGETIIKDFNKTSLDEFKYAMDVMLTSAYKTAKLAIKTMKKGGHLLFIGSSAAYKGREQFALYSTPKSALNTFAESIAEEFYKKYNIKVNIINPSITDTKMVKYLSSYAQNKEKLSTSDVATVVLRYLSSDAYGHRYLIRVGMPDK
jgi:2-C-methyl-D-erythritol 4-phosphate cytidylyltransferase